MPYKFVFKINNQENFSCNLTCVQCTEHKANGQQCSKRSCIGTPYCWIHLLGKKKLRIKPSGVPNAGKGLFAMSKNPNDNNAILFKTGDTIIEYDGEIITQQQLNNRYDSATHQYTAPYGLKVQNRIEDAACRRGVGSIANHGDSRHSNARFSRSNTGQPVKLFATKNIRNGDEILVNYGRSYRFNEPTSHTTKPSR